MQTIALREAEVKLAELIEVVASGGEVVITKNDGLAFKLISVLQKDPYPKFGSAEGLVEMSDDFDEPLECFEEYMP